MSSDKERMEEMQAELERIKGSYKDLQRQRERDKRTIEESQRQLAKATFSDFLQACHDDLFLKFEMETNLEILTTGGLTNVTGKLYPRRLRPWKGFREVLEKEFSYLEQTFGQSQSLPSRTELNLAVEDISDIKIGSEQALVRFEGTVVESRVKNMFSSYARITADSPGHRMPRGMRNISFTFEPFGVVATESGQDDGQESGKDERSGSRLIIKDDRPAYKGALAVAKADMERASRAEREKTDAPEHPRKRRLPERIRVRPDLWCFRVDHDKTIIPLYVIEYKAPHKINHSTLRKLLGSDTDEASASLMEDAVKLSVGHRAAQGDEKAMIDIATMVTQVYDYMVEYGLQYSYLTTGPAFIFFFLDPADSTTLYYRLEEPGVPGNLDARDKIKHSAVSLVLAFTFMSLGGQHMSQKWKKTMRETHPAWPTPFDDMGMAPRSDTSTASGDGADTTTESPTLHFESRDGGSEFCGDPQKYTTRRRRDGDDDLDPDRTYRPSGRGAESTTAVLLSRTTRSSAKNSVSSTALSNDRAKDVPETPSALPTDVFCSREHQAPKQPYCTQACLLGLKTGGFVDPGCPNTHLHTRAAADGHDTENRYTGDSNENQDDGDADLGHKKRQRHPISVAEFRRQLMDQLAQDMDHDCDNLERYGMFGGTGSMFKVALSRYGYCFIAKGVQRAHRTRLEKELAAYSVLEPCQGRLVPVNLGVIALVDEYYTMFGAHIAYMMLMSYCGQALRSHKCGTHEEHEALRLEMASAFQEIASLGLNHCDEREANAVWNEELQRVMIIDFSHSSPLEVRPTKKKRTKTPLSPRDANGNSAKRHRTLTTTTSI